MIPLIVLWLVGIVLAAQVLLWPVYMLVIQYKRGGKWAVLDKPAKVATVIDILLNYFLWSIFFGFPRAGEVTITKRLTRMKREGSKFAAFVCVRMLDPFDPEGCHCKG